MKSLVNKYITFLIICLLFNISYSQKSTNVSKNDLVVNNYEINSVQLNSILIPISEYKNYNKIEKKAIKLNTEISSETNSLIEVNEYKACIKVDDLSKYNFSKKEIQKLNQNNKTLENGIKEVTLEPTNLVPLIKS